MVGSEKSPQCEFFLGIFNVISLALILLPVYQISSFEIRSAFQNKEESAVKVSHNTNISDNPDIYYIILDSYGRDDILLELFDYDNSAFLNELREIGFYVADCSTSNYGKTNFSLASTLNMNYLDNLDIDVIPEKPGSRPDTVKFRSLIKDNEVRSILEAYGYTTVAFQTGFFWTSWHDADHYFAYEQDVQGNSSNAFFQAPLNEFEFLVIDTSAASVFLDLSLTTNINLGFETDDQDAIFDASTQRIRYNTVTYTLNTLEEIPSSIESPKLVFAHIVSPHAPYVLSPNGEFVSNQRNIDPGYLNQIIYLNKQVLSIVKNIIQTSEQPPVIIQGDHGSPRTNYTPVRLPILNAYYLPGNGKEKLYASITPVNTFRLILDHYFGTSYGLLDDVARYSTKNDIFNFKIVPNTCVEQ